jgi:hypothetical protein
MFSKRAVKVLSVSVVACVLLALPGIAGSGWSVLTRANLDGVRFVVQGLNVERIQVQVFGLSGQQVFDSGWQQGNTLTWMPQSRDGRPLASGVYLYSVTVMGPDGTLGHRLGKLVLTPQRAQVNNSLPQREPTESLSLAQQFQPLSHKDSKCSNVLQPYVDWLVKKPQGAGDYSVGFTLVSNSSNNVATFARGTLSYVSGLITLKHIAVPSAWFSGEGKQYFDDGQASGFDLDPRPFPLPPKTLKVKISIKNAAQVTLTQGSTTISFDAHCAGGMLYGMPTGLGRGAATMYVISLSKGFVGIPK